MLHFRLAGLLGSHDSTSDQGSGPPTLSARKAKGTGKGKGVLSGELASGGHERMLYISNEGRVRNGNQKATFDSEAG